MQGCLRHLEKSVSVKTIFSMIGSHYFYILVIETLWNVPKYVFILLCEVDVHSNGTSPWQLCSVKAMMELSSIG